MQTLLGDKDYNFELEALQNPTFSRLWFATVVSGICVSAHDTAATWMTNSISQLTLLLSLMSTTATLPFFLFILPAGAVADIAERKKVLSAACISLALCAGGLAILGWLHLLTPYVILGSVFLIGIGFAFNAPAFSAVVSEIVSTVGPSFCFNLDRFAAEHLGNRGPSSVRSTFAFRRSGILWFNTFRMEMMVPSWTQYLSQQDRMTKADREIIEQAESLHLAPNHPLETRMYLGVNKELPS
jgi:hypothetical protein